MVKTRFWGKGKSRNPGCCPSPGHLPPSWRCHGTGTPPSRAGGPAVPGPTTQTSSFQGKAPPGIGGHQPAVPARCSHPASHQAGAPVPRDGEKFVSGVEPQRAFPGVLRPGRPRLGAPQSRSGGRQDGDRRTGQITNAVLSRFPMPILPTRAALPRPATPEATLERERVGRGPLSPPVPGKTQRRDGGAGQRDRRTRDSGTGDPGIRCGSGAGAGFGLRAARRSLTTGTCWDWDGAAAPLLAGTARGPGSSLSALPPLLIFFPPYFFSFPSPLSPRWSLEMDGGAGRLTLALPLCAVPPSRPRRRTPPQCSQGKEFKGDTRHVSLRTLPCCCRCC